MSIQFSDTTNKSGIIQQIEKSCGFNDGDITGNTTKFAQFTADVNLALDSTYATIFAAGGTWQFDDSSHTDYPIITTDLVQGQRDYSFTVDGSGNLILDIYKVMVKIDGKYTEIQPVDQQRVGTDGALDTLTDGAEAQGVVYRYDKTANGIFLDSVPDAAVTAGLKVYVNREGSYFAVSDTTKKPGFAGLFHEYLSLIPSYKYSRDHSLDNLVRLERDIEVMKASIMEHYGKRERDISRRLVASRENNK